MKIEFQEKPHDIYVVLVFSTLLLIAVAVSSEGVPRIILGLIFILFLPGYSLIAALFPNGKDIDWIERIALSFGLSIAVTPLIGLLLNYTPWGIRLVPIVTSLFIFIVGMCAIAYWRRMRLPVEKRLSLSVELVPPAWKEYSLLDKALTIGLVISIVTAVGILAYALTVPRVGERFTEFYILDLNETAEDYPTNLTANQSAGVIIGVVNHEYATVNYSVQKDLVKVEFVYNETSEREEPVEISRKTIGDENITLKNKDTWEKRFNFTISEVGQYKLEFLLFKNEDFSQAYRSLHLWIDVS